MVLSHFWGVGRPKVSYCRVFQCAEVERLQFSLDFFTGFSANFDVAAGFSATFEVADS